MKLLIVTQKVDRLDPIMGFFHRWIEEFAKHVSSVMVICLEKGEYSLPENVSVFSLGKERKVSKISYVLNFYRFIFSLRKDYDRVFVHMNPIYVILGFPLWACMGKNIYLWYTHKNVDLKLRLAEKFVKKIFTASKESFQLATNKLIVTGHGIDTDKFSPIEPKKKDGKLVISSISRISRIKNLDAVIKCFSLLPKELITKAVLEIVGTHMTRDDKLYEGELKKMIDDIDLVDKIVWKGMIKNEDMPEYLKGVDLTLNLSVRGGMDKSVLESMACGVPVVTSNNNFKNTLEPLGLFVEKNDETLALKVAEVLYSRNENLSSKLRKIVLDDHCLEKLIMKICRVL